MPEEINRVLTDQLSILLFTPSTTLHRPSNVDDSRTFLGIVDTLNEIAGTFQ